MYKAGVLSHLYSYWCLVGNGWEWGLLGLLLIFIMDHSPIPYVSRQKVFAHQKDTKKNATNYGEKHGSVHTYNTIDR